MNKLNECASSGCEHESMTIGTLCQVCFGRQTAALDRTGFDASAKQNDRVTPRQDQGSDPPDGKITHTLTTGSITDSLAWQGGPSIPQEAERFTVVCPAENGRRWGWKFTVSLGVIIDEGPDSTDAKYGDMFLSPSERQVYFCTDSDTQSWKSLGESPVEKSELEPAPRRCVVIGSETNSLHLPTGCTGGIRFSLLPDHGKARIEKLSITAVQAGNPEFNAAVLVNSITIDGKRHGSGAGFLIRCERDVEIHAPATDYCQVEFEHASNVYGHDTAVYAHLVVSYPGDEK